jgi:uncharacterized membrane protein
MRTKIKKYKFILVAVFLMTGVSITGWAITFHYNHTAKSAESQLSPKNDSQPANIVPAAINHSHTILMLVCIGLIGFVGVRRQGKKVENLADVKPPERGNHEDFLSKNSPARQHSRG